MQRLLGGYTLIEVMLFLAISTVIFAVSVIVIQGQAGENEFRTSVDEVNQKFQQWIDQVQNGLTNSTSGSGPSQGTFDCSAVTIAGTRYPQLTPTANGNQRGTNSDCVFLGDAILLNNQPSNSNHIFAIPVIGLRTDDDQGDLSMSLRDAQPVAALNDGTYSRVNLSETYTVPNGTRVLWAGNNSSCASLSSSCNYLGGFFSNLSTSDASQGNGALSLITVRYPFYSDNANLSTSALDKCIALLSSGPCNGNAALSGNLWPMNAWEVCLVSTRTDDWATLTINSDNGYGANTSVQYGKGGAVCP